MVQKRRHGLEGYQIKHEFIDNPQAAEEAMNNLAYMIARGILEDEKKKAAQMEGKGDEKGAAGSDPC